MRVWVSLLLAALAGAGCSHRNAGTQPGYSAVTGAGTPAAPQLIVTPENVLVGKVASVNRGGRFVVLSFPLARFPTRDAVLNLYRRGLKVGEVRITGDHLDENIIADIVTGEAEVGDEARDR